MPCYSKKEDREDAELVVQALDVKLIDVDITKTYNFLEEELQNKLGYSLVEESKINIKPRLRMTALYAMAQTLGYLVIGTGNLSEGMMGYTTKWGDSSSDFNPIGNFTKEEVVEIGRILGIPEKILEKAPSDGISSKTDEEKMGVEYSKIEEYIKTGKTDSEAMKIIEKLNKASKHKRVEVPTYYLKRKNYLN